MTVGTSTAVRAYSFGGSDSENTKAAARAFHTAVVAERAGYLTASETYPSYNGNLAVWLVYSVYDELAIDTIYNRMFPA